MSLSYHGIQSIRKIVEETVEPLRGDLEALSNGLKDIYSMISELQKSSGNDASTRKLNVEQQILRLHAELVETAKQAGVALPSR